MPVAEMFGGFSCARLNDGVCGNHYGACVFHHERNKWRASPFAEVLLGDPKQPLLTTGFVPALAAHAQVGSTWKFHTQGRSANYAQSRFYQLCFISNL
jgi:hypothetical protein